MRNTLNATPARLPLLSQTGEHALRALLYLARRPGTLVSAQEIAESLGAPANYLSKTLRVLAKRGLLTSVRGPHGGFGIAVPVEEITPARVVEAVDDVSVPATCLLGDRSCDHAEPCAVHARWAELKDQVMAPMENTSIADLLADVPPTSPDPTKTSNR